MSELGLPDVVVDFLRSQTTEEGKQVDNTIKMILGIAPYCGRCLFWSWVTQFGHPTLLPPPVTSSFIGITHKSVSLTVAEIWPTDNFEANLTLT